MKTVILISCVSKKQEHPAPVRDLYTSPLFQLNLAYAESLDPDDIFILSAKHGLLPLDETIAPFDVTLNKMNANGRRAWTKHLAGSVWC